MKAFSRISLFTAGLAAALALSTGAIAGSDEAMYEVTFTPMWTAQSHPFEYPKAGLISVPHFSGVIGASHNGKFGIFKEGSMPTAGLEALSEMGKHSPLDKEIKAAIAARSAGALFETDGIKDLSKSATTSVRVTSAFPEISAVAMIAPSPDWFAGVSDVSLMEGGQWVVEKTLDVYAFDSGGDDGTTYTADDKDNSPKKPTTLAMSQHFVVNGKPVPVARITFKRK